jgi:hypothetical protein
MPPCYNGPNPADDQETRMAIWKWAKENGIDQGLPMEKVHDAINQKFFAGQGKPEWINDILSGRKTPFRRLADDAWAKQRNRRLILQQARSMYKDYNTPKAQQVARKLWEFPRRIVTFGHGIVFPITHGGDLILRPESWGPMLRNTYLNWTKSWSKAQTERILDSMRRDPLYRLAVDGGLKVQEGYDTTGIIGPHGIKEPHPLNVLARVGRWSDEQSARSLQFLTKLRFDVWKQQMEQNVNPATMTHEQMLDYSKNLADWANHATGTTTEIKIPFGAELMFGPKLTASKISRIVSDPLKTLGTWVNPRATPGQRAVAMTRAFGAAQYFATGMGFLALNQALLHLFGLKQQINVTDPTKKDYLQFKGFGMEGDLGGLHSEARAVGKFIATVFANEKALAKTPPFGGNRYAHLQDVVARYAWGKASPLIQRGIEGLAGENFRGRPVPWSSNPGTEKAPRMTWGEYMGSIGPIPLSEGVKYFYDEFRKRGASVAQAASIIKGLIITGLGATGLKVQSDEGDITKSPVRARHERAQLAR